MHRNCNRQFGTGFISVVSNNVVQTTKWPSFRVYCWLIAHLLVLLAFDWCSRSIPLGTAGTRHVAMTSRRRELSLLVGRGPFAVWHVDLQQWKTKNLIEAITQGVHFIDIDLIVTTRVRSTTGGYVFTGICLLTRGKEGGCYPSLWSQVPSQPLVPCAFLGFPAFSPMSLVCVCVWSGGG